MPKTKISEFSATPANNTDIDSINISEGCAPSGINDAIRELMAQLKDFQTGAVGDSFNGPVGTTTAAAGAFTTLAASGAVTLSGGTANGVAYLNGSKVVTSGSALTFDGTLLTVASSTPKIRLSDSGLANDFGIDFYFPSIASSYGQITLNGSTGGMRFVAGKSGSSGYYQAFELNGSEQMRLTSTGLGIGTSSPTSKLTVVGTVKSASATQSSFYLSNAAQTNGFLLGRSLSSDDAQNFFIYDTVAAATRLYLDSSGNLGLGVTPSAWQVNNRALQLLEGYASISSNNSQGCCDVAANCFNGGSAATSGWKYTNSGSAVSLFQQQAGAFKFLTAPSGTAGNAITFTQAATLTAGGDWGIGTTSPAQRIHASSAGAVTRVLVENTDNGSAGAGIQMLVKSGASTVGNGTIRIDNADNLQFFNIGGERARIDSSGRFMVATTSAGGTISCARNGGTYNYYATSDANNTTEGFFLGYSSGAGANRIIIYSNGNVVNANNSYGALSDSKLKENIVDATPKLAGLMQVKVRNYNLIGESTKQLGVVAQELETVFPAMVDESPDRDAEGNDLGTTTKSVKYSVFVPMLIKAMQEQQAIIESLKARLDAANL